MARNRRHFLEDNFEKRADDNVAEWKVSPGIGLNAIPLDFNVPKIRKVESNAFRGVFLSETGEAILISSSDGHNMKCGVPPPTRTSTISAPSSTIFRNVNALAKQLNEATRPKTIKQEACFMEHVSVDETVHADLITNSAALRIRSGNTLKHKSKRFSSVDAKISKENDISSPKLKRKSLPTGESSNNCKFRSSKPIKKCTYPEAGRSTGKRRNCTKLCFENQLKVVNYSYSADFQDAFPSALANCFYNALRSGLFMHQSQLESFINLIHRESSANNGSNVQVIEQLQDILTRLVPCSSSSNFLVEMLNCFLVASDALPVNRFHQYNNLKDAAEIIGKLKIMHSLLKNTAFVKTFVQKMRSNVPNFLPNRPMFAEFCRNAMPKYDTNLAWRCIRPIFEDELYEEESDNFEYSDGVFDNNDDLTFENANFQTTADFNTFPLKPTNRYCICRVGSMGHGRDNARTCDYCKFKFLDGELFILHNKKYIPAWCKFGIDYCVERIPDSVPSSPPPPSVLSLEKSRSINDYLNLVDIIDSANYQESDQTCDDFDVETFAKSQLQVADDENGSADFNDIFDWPLENLDSVLVTPIKKSKMDEESGWSESNDRCLLEELHKFNGDISRASIQVARILNIDFEMVQRRMEMLVEMLENADV